MVELNREQSIEKIRELLKEGKKNQESRKAILEKIINKKFLAPPRLYAQLITITLREVPICLEIAYVARPLKNVHIEVITNWAITDLSDSAGA